MAILRGRKQVRIEAVAQASIKVLVVCALALLAVGGCGGEERAEPPAPDRQAERDEHRCRFCLPAAMNVSDQQPNEPDQSQWQVGTTNLNTMVFTGFDEDNPSVGTVTIQRNTWRPFVHWFVRIEIPGSGGVVVTSAPRGESERIRVAAEQRGVLRFRTLRGLRGRLSLATDRIRLHCPGSCPPIRYRTVKKPPAAAARRLEALDSARRICGTLTRTASLRSRRPLIADLDAIAADAPALVASDIELLVRELRKLQWAAEAIAPSVGGHGDLDLRELDEGVAFERASRPALDRLGIAYCV